jgi:hypothetical protein
VNTPIVITLATRAALFAYPPGTRIEWRLPRANLRTRIWRWLTKQNYRVARVDFEAEALVVERCR